MMLPMLPENPSPDDLAAAQLLKTWCGSSTYNSYSISYNSLRKGLWTAIVDNGKWQVGRSSVSYAEAINEAYNSMERITRARPR